eukprot:5997724-Prorocentrum_lima.AAC.1
MTSSLVGSEMCIRDSSKRKATSYLIHAGISLKCWYWACCQAGYLYRMQAVSYTHLTLPTICSV